MAEKRPTNNIKGAEKALAEKQKKAREELPPPQGFTLRDTLTKHSLWIFSLAWSPDGQTLASGSYDSTIRLWNSPSAKSLGTLGTLQGHIGSINSIAWFPDGRILASGSGDQTICLWRPQFPKSVYSPPQQPIQTLQGHTDAIMSVAWSPPFGAMLASGSADQTIRLWELPVAQSIQTLQGHTNIICSVAWSPDGRILASGSADRTIRLWRPSSSQPIQTLQGHTSIIYSVAWSPDGRTLASGSGDQTIRLWNPFTGQCTKILETHTEAVKWVSFSPDGRLLGSKSQDGTFRLWRTDTWACISTLYEYCSSRATFAFNPKRKVLATLGGEEKNIRIWDLDMDTMLNIETPTAVSYTNAKVVLLGDTGVGKSGLGLVLSGQRFVPTASSHGRRVWKFDRQEIRLDKKRQETRETLLWDLAGQPGYRLVHQLHLNEVAVALIVFDAHSETDPLAGIYYWDRALRQAQRVQGSAALPLKKILVQARIDCGGIGVSHERIQALIDECGFDAYFETSAQEGWHISDLRAAICQAIDWDGLPKISSTQLFQNIKSFLVTEKETGRYLATVDDLYNAFLKTKDVPTERENLYAQFETCTGRVEAASLIKCLSFGNLVLLQPELLDSYVSALINAVRDEPDGLGSIEEERVRKGDFRIPHDERIKDKEQEKLLLITMIEDMVRRELALREEQDLVFPSQSTRDNPALPDPEGKSVVFTFEGPILSIYATLAVRLSHSGLFKKKELWKNAIIYTATIGGQCGLFLRNIGEGQGELHLFFDKNESASEETRFYFEEFVQTHLLRKAIPETLKRRRIFSCNKCGFIVPDQLIRIRNERGFDWLDCSGCNNNRISLLDREERLTTTSSPRVLEMDRTADKQRDREAAQSTIQGKEATMDFNVFLCHNGIDKPAVEKIAEQLKERGLLPWLDKWELRPGLPWQRALEEQIEHIQAAAVFVGKDGIGPWQQMELEAFLREFVRRGSPVIPVLLDYAPKEPKLPVFLRGMTWVDFRKTDSEPLENLIWGITGTRKSGY